MRQLFKTTVIFWSEYDTLGLELSDMGYGAENGDMYCSKCERQLVEDPEKDPDWDDTEFFDI